VRDAFIEASAFQRGYCTPGFVLAVTQLIDEHADPRSRLSRPIGNRPAACDDPTRSSAARRRDRRLLTHHPH
jgi:aerobic-type carbon monoxide dehydrogenase small subunit (CoxS/CutS family)